MREVYRGPAPLACRLGATGRRLPRQGLGMWRLSGSGEGGCRPEGGARRVPYNKMDAPMSRGSSGRARGRQLPQAPRSTCRMPGHLHTTPRPSLSPRAQPRPTPSPPPSPQQPSVRQNGVPQSGEEALAAQPNLPPPSQQPMGSRAGGERRCDWPRGGSGFGCAGADASAGPAAGAALGGAAAMDAGGCAPPRPAPSAAPRPPQAGRARGDPSGLPEPPQGPSEPLRGGALGGGQGPLSPLCPQGGPR